MKNFALLVSICLFLPGFGCVEKLPLGDRACPCLSGWRCCEGNLCVPNDQNCPGCDILCASGERCYDSACVQCNNNKACGTDCINCHDQAFDWHCHNGRCGCVRSADCGNLECREGSCAYDTSDAGICDGNCDGGIVEDGGTSDGGSADGGGDDINPYCANNKHCGPDCEDCTERNGNWACLGSECGCFDSADCLPDQDCQDNSCVP